MIEVREVNVTPIIFDNLTVREQTQLLAAARCMLEYMLEVYGLSLSTLGSSGTTKSDEMPLKSSE